MKKYILSTIIILGFLFLISEAVARIFAVNGSFDFIERRIFEEGLKPRKPAGEYRILTYGESTMHGNHLFPKSTIARWIEIYLNNLIGPEQAKRFKVVNLGRLGATSDFISQSFFDTLAYKPDLAVFYTAHNDFIQLENRQNVLRRHGIGDVIGDFFGTVLKKSSFLSAIKRSGIKMKMARKKISDAAKEPSDQWYNEDERTKMVYDKDKDLLEPNGADFKTIESNWQNNVNKIIDVAHKHHVPVVFLSGVAKYKEYAPFESKHRAGLSDGELKEWEGYVQTAAEYATQEDYDHAQEFYAKALALDNQYALTYFHLGEAWEHLADYEKAKEFYVMANDKDYFPIRAPQAVNRFYEDLARKEMSDVYVIKPQPLFEAKSPNGLIDSTLILDQLHPTIEGQALMALEIVRWIYANTNVVDKSLWHWEDLKSEKELEEELKIDDDFEFSINIYSAKYVGSYHNQAKEYLAKALAIKPHAVAARSQLAWILWHEGQKNEAIALYKQLFKDSPQQASEFSKRHPEISAEVVSK